MKAKLSSPNLQWDENNHPFSLDYDDIYFSKNDPVGEKRHVFIKGCDIEKNWHGKDFFHITELGFGTGLNFLLTLECWKTSSNSPKYLQYTAIEKHPLSAQDILKALGDLLPNNNDLISLIHKLPEPIFGAHRLYFENGQVCLNLIYEDVSEALEMLKDGRDGGVNAWYIDGFSPAKNQQLWQFHHLPSLSEKDAKLASYSVASSFCQQLQENGFVIKKTPGFGQKKHQLSASFEGGAPQKILFKDKPWFYPAKAQRDIKTITIIGDGIAGRLLGHALHLLGAKAQIISSGLGASRLEIGLLAPRPQRGGDVASQFYNLAYYDALRFYKSFNAPLYDRHAHYYQQDSDILQGLCDELPYLQKIDAHKAFVAKAPIFSGQDMLKHFDPQSYGNAPIIERQVKAIHKEKEGWVLFDESQNEILTTKILAICAGKNICDLLRDYFPLKDNLQQVSTDMRLFYSDEMDSISHYGKGIFSAMFNNKRYLVGDENDMPAPVKAIIEGSQEINNWSDVKIRGRDMMPMLGAVPDEGFYRNVYDDLHHGRHYKSYPAAKYLKGLYFMAGLGSRGFQIAPILAHILAHEMMGLKFPLPPTIRHALHPARFLIKELRRNKMN